MIPTLKRLVLHAARTLGLFALARRLTRDRLRILAYHGIALAGEDRFRPKLFMRPETFEARLRLLQRLGSSVLPLGEALERLQRGTLPAGATVITIDDGWYGTWKEGLPALERAGFPATLYVTTHYALKQTQIFEVALGYLLWRTERDELPLDGLGAGLGGRAALDGAPGREALASRIARLANENLDAAGRQALLERIGERLGVAVAPLREAGAFHLMSPEQIREASARGLDIQLHTHRHHLDLTDRVQVEREIDDNRAVLEPLAGRALRHFCYPSGVHAPSLWPWLEAKGIRSATLTTPGLCDPFTPRLALPRFLDGEDVHPIELESELSGLNELLRGVRRWGMTGRSAPAPSPAS